MESSLEKLQAIIGTLETSSEHLFVLLSFMKTCSGFTFWFFSGNDLMSVACENGLSPPTRAIRITDSEAVNRSQTSDEHTSGTQIAWRH